VVIQRHYWTVFWALQIHDDCSVTPCSLVNVHQCIREYYWLASSSSILMVQKRSTLMAVCLFHPTLPCVPVNMHFRIHCLQKFTSQKTIQFPHPYGTALGTFTVTLFSSHLCPCLPDVSLPLYCYDNFERITTALLHATCPLSQPTSFSKWNRLIFQCGPFLTQRCTCSWHKSRGIPSSSLMSGDWYQFTIATGSIC